MMKAIAVFVFAALALLVTGCDDDKHPSAVRNEGTSTAAAVAGETPQTTSSPSRAFPTIRGQVTIVTVQPWQVGDPMDLPERMAIIVETGCFQCDGPATGLARVYRDGSGAVRSDTLIRYAEGGRDQPYISSLVVAPDGSDMAVTICTRGYCGPANAITPDAATLVLRSRDGGVTWSEIAAPEGAFDAVAVVVDGIVLFGPFGAWDDPAPLARAAYRLLPDGTPIVRPAVAGNGSPLRLPDGGLGWLSEDHRAVLAVDGARIASIMIPAEAEGGVQVSVGDRQTLATWFADQAGTAPADGPYFLGVFAPDGREQREFAAQSYLSLGVRLDDRRLLGNAVLQLGRRSSSPDLLAFVPALIDVEDGEIRPLDADFGTGRNIVRAVMRGPFVRVVASGDCLNVRAEPRAAAPAVACAADGVLLTDLGETRQTAEGDWLRVRTPAGEEGWASLSYLER